jgi:hypothetical protein
VATHFRVAPSLIMLEFVPSVVCIRSWHIQGQFYPLDCEKLFVKIWQKRTDTLHEDPYAFPPA